MFERFFRVDRSRTRATGGSGLGLAIARDLVTAHGGSIWVDDVARGALVRIELPAMAGEPDATAPQSPGMLAP